MTDTFIIVFSCFFALFAVCALATLALARHRQKRTARLMKEMMEEYERVYSHSPDDFLRDNIIEFQDHRWRNFDRNKKK